MRKHRGKRPVLARTVCEVRWQKKRPSMWRVLLCLRAGSARATIESTYNGTVVCLFAKISSVNELIVMMMRVTLYGRQRDVTTHDDSMDGLGAKESGVMTDCVVE